MGELDFPHRQPFVASFPAGNVDKQRATIPGRPQRHDEGGTDERRARARACETVVVGGGQAGLSVGHHLARRGLPFVILDAHTRIGDSWRNRWDSLRLFTPARYNGLDGMPFPGPVHSFSTKDEVADYLEIYAARFDLPVRTGVEVDRISRNGHDGARFVVTAGESVRGRQRGGRPVELPKTAGPPFADELDPGVVQLHSTYRNPSQLRDGGVLVVGAGNSGAEIALEVATSHPTWLSGRNPAMSRSASSLRPVPLPTPAIPVHRPPA